MSRKRYPSDDNRGSRPFVRIDLRARNHRIAGPVFADPLDRGVLLGLWMLGRENFAGSTGDVVTLTHSDLHWITGKQTATRGAAVLVRVCRRMRYAVWIHEHGARVPAWETLAESAAAWDSQVDDPWTGGRLLLDGSSTAARPPMDDHSLTPRRIGAVSVLVRNLAKKQGSTPRTPQDSARSSAQREREEKEKEKERESGGGVNGSRLGLARGGVIAALLEVTNWNANQCDQWLEANRSGLSRAAKAKGIDEVDQAVKRQALFESIAIAWAKAERHPPTG